MTDPGKHQDEDVKEGRKLRRDLSAVFKDTCRTRKEEKLCDTHVDNPAKQPGTCPTDILVSCRKGEALGSQPKVSGLFPDLVFLSRFSLWRRGPMNMLYRTS